MPMHKVPPRLKAVIRDHEEERSDHQLPTQAKASLRQHAEPSRYESTDQKTADAKPVAWVVQQVFDFFENGGWGVCHTERGKALCSGVVQAFPLLRYPLLYPQK